MLAGNKNTSDNRFSLMGKMLRLVKPLAPAMLGAVAFGTLGHLAAIFVVALGAKYLLLLGTGHMVSVTKVCAALLVMGVMRGIFRYGEQYLNHYVAFRLLALIRSKVFGVLRTLAPAKFETKEKGDLIAMITTDIELMEVFYAHTISPVLIALAVGAVMLIHLGRIHLWYAGILGLGYVAVGILIPLWNERRGRDTGKTYREEYASLNTMIYENLRGAKEIKKYNATDYRRKILKDVSWQYEKTATKLHQLEVGSFLRADGIIYLVTLGALCISWRLVETGSLPTWEAVYATLVIMGSFGPVVALSNLSNNLMQTFACAERVISLLEEKPLCPDVEEGYLLQDFHDLTVKDLQFSYQDEKLLDKINLTVQKGETIVIKGPSGSGKSTLLKLLMHFYRRNGGDICYNGRDVEVIRTACLRRLQSYVKQETEVFHGTIEENLRIAKPDATREEMMSACQKASLHDFILELEQGYDTPIVEYGENLSQGEKQRLSMARAFLHDGAMMILDEPTANIDILNEAMILQSIQASKGDKTVLMVTHKDTGRFVADRLIDMSAM